VEGKEEILARVIPDRGQLARRLCGMGLAHSPECDAVTELTEEREREDHERMRALGA
jgi:hypothetical protein